MREPRSRGKPQLLRLPGDPISCLFSVRGRPAPATLNPFSLEQRFFPRAFKTHGSHQHCPKGARCVSVARFMGVPLDDDLLRLVRERSSLDHMLGIAAKSKPSQRTGWGVVLCFGLEMRSYDKNMEFGKLRRGIAGDRQRFLPREILDELRREWQERIIPVFGYENYEEMRRACSLLRRAECHERS